MTVAKYMYTYKNYLLEILSREKNINKRSRHTHTLLFLVYVLVEYINKEQQLYYTVTQSSESTFITCLL